MLRAILVVFTIVAIGSFMLAAGPAEASKNHRNIDNTTSFDDRPGGDRHPGICTCGLDSKKGKGHKKHEWPGLRPWSTTYGGGIGGASHTILFFHSVFVVR